MKISITGVATHFPIKKKTVGEIIGQSRKATPWVKDCGIREVYVENNNHSITDIATEVTKKVLNTTELDALNIDQLVFISEGISDYLYMDTSKSILRKIGSRMNGNIHASDLFRGSNGTLELIKLIGNQIKVNPDIETSIIVSALNWEYHSNNRILGTTILGDGAGAVLLSKNSADNKIMGIASECMSEFCMVTGFKYGGTRNDFSDKNIHNNKFCFDILEESHLKGVLDNIVSVSWEVVKKVLQKADMEINDIDFIGITGFHKRVNNSILKGIKTKAHIIEYIETKGYLGSVGSIEILNCFINNEKIQKDSKLLIIANGIDANVEAMIIKK